jgi:hypothetical protein
MRFHLRFQEQLQHHLLVHHPWPHLHLVHKLVPRRLHLRQQRQFLQQHLQQLLLVDRRSSAPSAEHHLQ